MKKGKSTRQSHYQAFKKKVALVLTAALVTTSLSVTGVRAENNAKQKGKASTQKEQSQQKKERKNSETEKKKAQKHSGESRQELKKERTENSTTYQLENGRKETEFYAEDVRYVDEKTGKLTDYDPTLQSIETRKDYQGSSLAGYQYENKQGQEKNYLPEILEEDTPVLTESGTYQAAILPESNTEKIEKKSEECTGAACPEKETIENLYGEEKTAITGASYQTEENIRYHYESQKQGIKENIILEKEPESNIFWFRLILTDAYLAVESEKHGKEETGEGSREEKDTEERKNGDKSKEEKNGKDSGEEQKYQKIVEKITTAQGEDLYIQNKKKDCIGILPAGNVNDATGSHFSENCTYTVKYMGKEKDGKTIKSSYRIGITVEGDYLKKKSTVYPVTIDPSCYWQSGNTERSQCTISDTYVRSGSKTTANFGSSRSLLAGRDTDGSIERSFIKFNNLTQDIKGKYIQYATLELREYGNSSKDLTVNLNRVTSQWNCNSVCYGNQPGVDSTVLGRIYSSGTPGTLHYTTITEYVVGVLTGKYVDYGIALVSATEGNSARNHGAFYSADSQWGPKLTVTYQDAPTAPENITLERDYVGLGGTSAISWSGISSPSLSGYQYRLVYCGSGSSDIIQVQNFVPLTSSGGNYYIRLESCTGGDLPEGNYAVYLRGVDSQGNAGKEGKGYICLDKTRPAKASLTLKGTDQVNYHNTLPIIQWSGATDNVGIDHMVFSLNGKHVSTGSNSASGTYAFQPGDGIQNGENKIVMHAYDSASNISTTDPITYYYDGEAPKLTVGNVTPATTKDQPSTLSPTVLYGAKDNIGLGQIQYSFDGVNYSGASAGSSTSYTIPPERFMGSGTYTLYLRLTDKAGNTSTVYTYPYYFKDLSQDCLPGYMTARENMSGSTTITWEKKYTDSLPVGASYSLYGSKEKGFTPGQDTLIRSGIRTNSYTLTGEQHKDIRYYKLCVVRMQNGKEVNRKYTGEIYSKPVSIAERDKKVGECSYSGSEAPALPGGSTSIRKDSGNLTYTAEGLSLPALHFTIPVTPVYNSDRDYEGVLGKGWMLPQERQLWKYGNEYYYMDETGAVHQFTDKGNGSTSPSLLGKTVREQAGHFKTKNGEISIDFQYVMENSEGKEYYSQEGRLVAEVENDGAYLLYQYNENDGTLLEMITATGRKARFHYDEQARESGKSRLLSVTYSNSEGKLCAETISFTYQEGRLSGIVHTGTDGKSTSAYTYAYEDGRLCQITSPGEKKAKVLYRDGRVYRVTGIAADTTEFTYQTDSSGQRVGRIDITCSDETGKLTSSAVTILDTEGRITKDTDNQGLITTYEYGSGMDFYQPTKVTTESEYQVLTSEGKVETRKETKTTESNYNESGNISKEIDENGGVTTYEYEDSTNSDQPTKIVEISGEGSTNTETMTYDARGNLLTDKTVDEGETTITRNEYEGDSGEDEEYLDNEIIEETGSSTTLQGQDSSSSTSVYDEEGNVTEETVLSGTTEETTTTKYDDMGRVVSEENETEGTKSSYTYDAFGRTIKTTVTYTKGEQKGTIETEEKTYDAEGNILTETAKDGVVTTYRYDDKNRIVTETISKGENRTRSYSYRTENITVYGGQGIKKTIPVSIKTIKNEEGIITDITCTDAEGRTVRSYNDGIYTDTWYDCSGHGVVTCVLGTTLPEQSSENQVLANSQVSIQLYDADGNATHHIINPVIQGNDYYAGEDSLQAVSEYDKDGNVTSRTDAMGNTTKYTYAGGELASVEKADGTEGNSYRYSQIYTGDTVKIPDGTGTDGTQQKPLADVTVNSRGKISRTITNAAGQTLAVEDEADGKKIATCYEYDQAGNKTKEIYGTGAYLVFQYDSKGEITVEKSYDKEDSQTGETNYTYDTNGNVTKMVDYQVKDGKKTALRTTMSYYDHFQRLTAYAEIEGTDNPSDSQKEECKNTYVYDTCDRLVETTCQEREGITGMKYEYNVHGWLTKVTVKRADGEEVVLRRYTYDSHGKVSSMVDTVDYLKDGEHTLQKTYTYDKYDRATGIKVTDQKTGKVMQTYTYAYDKNGNITRKAEQSSYTESGVDRVTEYQYNKLGELTESTQKNHLTGTGSTITYTYDAAGNRTGVTKDGNTTVYTYNGLDQITRAVTSGNTSETKTYTYDGAGNQIQVTATDSSNGGSELIQKYTYDTKNQLTRVSKDTGNGEQTIQENWYNGDGQRIGKKEGSRKTNYYYQNGSLFKSTDDAGTLQAMYLYGAEGNAIGVVDGSEVTASGETSYLYTKDMQGSIINLVDEKGVGITAYDYDDYGNTTIIGKQDTANELAYTGGVYDKTTEEYYLNARYYSPEDGRFLSMDTERGENTEYQTWNLYGYCGGDPVNYVDPSGHKYVHTSKSIFKRVQENYKYNKKHDFLGKYIYEQNNKKIKKMKFQKRRIKDYGCGPVAIYNAFLFVGRRPLMSMVIKEVEEAYQPCDDHGATIEAMINVLKNHNILKSKKEINNSTLNKKMSNCDSFILYYETRRGGNHYVFGVFLQSQYRIWNVEKSKYNIKKYKKLSQIDDLQRAKYIFYLNRFSRR